MAECHCTEHQSIVMLGNIIPCVIMLSIIMLSVIMLSVIMLSGITLSGITQSVSSWLAYYAHKVSL